MQVTPQSLHYRFNFLKYQGLSIIVFLLALGIGIAGYVVRGGFQYHIDFTGGAEVRLSFASKLETSNLRSIMSKHGWSDAVIQEIGTTGQSFLIRIGVEKLDASLEQQIKAKLLEELPENRVVIENVEWVGAEVGKDTKWNAIKAIFLSCIILLLYIAVRSQFRFGIGATAALIHDLFIVMVFLLVSGEPISLHVLAAVLAVLGYSLNDTIVIFSRIQENLKKFRGVSETEIVNLSINQTLTRTILTSFATLLSVLAILFLGGETLRGLSLVMCIGIIFGTYSSIYVASAVMLLIGKLKNKKTVVSH